MRRRIRGVGAAAALAAFAGVAAFATTAAFAQYPDRPIRIIVPFSPGGGTDLTARLLAQKLAEPLGRQVIVENRAGAAGNIGTEMVAKAPPDGYTLLAASLSNSVNPSLFKKLSFNALEFEAISLVATVPLLLVVNPQFPAQTVGELIALAKAKPGSINYASGGNGTANHVGGELFKYMAGVQLNMINYKGGGPALADVIGGHVPIFFGTMTSTRDLAKAGKVRALASTTLKRSPSWPELPTVAESGVPGFDVSAWFGIMAPGGTPRPIIDRLHTELAAVMRLADVRDWLMKQGNDPIGSTPEEFARFYRAEVEKWSKVVAAAKMTAE